MLAADKLQLQSAVKQQATALKEKEFLLHVQNFMTVGTQAAVLAGLDVVMFIEFTPAAPNDKDYEFGIWPSRILKFTYYITIISAFCANMVVVSHTTALSVLGASLALRGPDGSMMTATDGLYVERPSVFGPFRFGLGLTVLSCVLGVWLILHWEAAMACSLIALYTYRLIYNLYHRVVKRFDFDEEETVDFRDIMEGPGSIRVEISRNNSRISISNNNSNNASVTSLSYDSGEDEETQDLTTERGVTRRRNPSSAVPSSPSSWSSMIFGSGKKR